MPVSLGPDAQQLVDQLLSSPSDSDRWSAVTAIPQLPDKLMVESYLIEHLGKATIVWERTWALTALAALKTQRANAVILQHVDEKCESMFWARHFAILNAAQQTPFPTAAVEQALTDSNGLVRATALRALLGEAEDQYVNDLLQMLGNKNEPQDRWGAARALRQRPGMKDLRAVIEGHFIDPLGEVVRDRFLWTDARWEAVQALSTVHYRKREAAEVLGEPLLKRDPDNYHRRTCLDALVTLGQPQESQAPLLAALEDDDAEVRVRCANGLKKILGPDKAIQLIAERALGGQGNQGFLVDALRCIGQEASAQALRGSLANSDPKVSERASQLLAQLGGEEANRILMSSRAVERYNTMLKAADDDVMKQFQRLNSQATSAFWLTMLMHAVIFGLGVWLLLSSLSLALAEGLTSLQGFIGVAAGGVLTILASFYQSPLQNVRASVTALMKVNVVFLGYVRQVNQIDATFKHLFLGYGEFGVGQMKDTVTQIQDAVKDTLEEIKTHMAEA